MNETIETEVIPDQAIAVRAQAPILPPPALFGTSEPTAIVAKATIVANALKEVIRKQGLISSISGKEYPRCEAWTLLGTMLGIFPVLTWTRKLEKGWEARVEAKTRDGAIVGAAEAECTRDERNWSNRDDFALRSMAQTRATAKCLRMPLGFVMTLAGFEATPAEEMSYDAPQSSANAPRSDFKPKTDPIPAQKPTVAFPTPEQRTKMIQQLNAEPGKPDRDTVLEYFRKAGAILDTEELEDIPLRYVPATASQMRKIASCIVGFSTGERAELAFPPHDEPLGDGKRSERPPMRSAPVERQVSNADAAQSKSAPSPTQGGFDYDADDAPWRSFPVPFGKNAGKKLADLPKNTLFGFWANFEVQTEYNGKPCAPARIAKDRTFREMLDQAGEHYEFEAPEDEHDHDEPPY